VGVDAMQSGDGEGFSAGVREKSKRRPGSSEGEGNPLPCLPPSGDMSASELSTVQQPESSAPTPKRCPVRPLR